MLNGWTYKVNLLTIRQLSRLFFYFDNLHIKGYACRKRRALYFCEVENMNNDENKKADEKPTITDVPQETNPQEDGETSSPKKESTDKPVDTAPSSDDAADSKAKLQGLSDKLDSAIDLLTSILNAVSNDGDSKENDEPDKKEDSDNDNSVEDFENLL